MGLKNLTIYDVILGPVVTSKSNQLQQKLNKLVLQVHPAANKPLIKEALGKLLNVQVQSIHIINRRKARRVGRKMVPGTLRKKAIVTLAPGFSLDFAGTTGPAAVEQTGASTVE
jgi:large subunit ribosomal protein L23